MSPLGPDMVPWKHHRRKTRHLVQSHITTPSFWFPALHPISDKTESILSPVESTASGCASCLLAGRSTSPSRADVYSESSLSPPDFKMAISPLPNSCRDNWGWNPQDKSQEVRLSGAGNQTAHFHPNWSIGAAGVRGHALYHQAIAITGRWPCRRESMARVWWLGWGRAGLAFTPTPSSTFSEKMARAGGFHTRAPSGMGDSQSRSHHHSPKTSPRRWESSSTGGREVWRSSRTTISWARPLRTSTKATTSSFPSCARRRPGRRWRWSRCDEASPRSSIDVGMRSRRACLRRSVFTRCRCPTFSRTSFWIPCEQG